MALHRIAEELEIADRLQRKGECDRARVLYEAILAAVPRHHGATLGLARCQLNVGEFEEAIETFRRAKAIDPGHHQGRIELVQSLLLLGLRDEARGELEDLDRLDPPGPGPTGGLRPRMA